MLHDPVGLIGRHQSAIDEKNDVDEPPESESTQCDHFAHGDANVSERIAIDSK